MKDKKSDYPEAKSKNLTTLFSELKSGPTGLKNDEAVRRLSQYGPNAIEEKKESVIIKFLSYFWGPIAWMIETAAVLSAIVGHWADFIIILIEYIFKDTTL